MAAALPVLEAVPDCADFSLTVAPYLPQFTSIPSAVFAAGLNGSNLLELYANTNPLVSAIWFTILLAPVFLVVSEVNKNYSQVDRCWGLLPVLHNVHYTLWSHLNQLPSTLVDSVLAITSIWTIRLTYNAWRKGLFRRGEQDYRWNTVKEKLNNKYIWFFVNLVFISSLQLFLLMLVTAPTYIFVVYSNQRQLDHRLEVFDYTFLEILLFALAIETLADNEQWDFQIAKKEYLREARVPDEYKPAYSADDLNRGFVVNGLWSLCRHPNFAAEQAFWITIHQWCCLKSRTWFNWAGVGAIFYVALFQASTSLTEKLSAQKYPEYKDYQECVGKFIPRCGVDPTDGSPRLRGGGQDKGVLSRLKTRVFG